MSVVWEELLPWSLIAEQTPIPRVKCVTPLTHFCSKFSALTADNGW